jgi:eukaryotic-like serine/threonine-protein kinase
MVTNGTRLGPYEVVSPIGAGGMGEVYKARDTRLERSVAIKILPAEFAHNAQLRARFEREAKSISALNHPHICTLYDVGEAEVDVASPSSAALRLSSAESPASSRKIFYLVMEYIEGESLADRIAKGPLPLEQVIRYGVQIADALDRAHRAGIVHRDVKPGNVMLTKGGAKLLDFGLAKESESPAVQALTSFRTEKRSLTEEGTILGTFQYMAPEQLEGIEADARTDIFAFGAVLYEMVTGRRAFDGKSKASLIASILTAEPQSITKVLPASPAALDRLIRVCLNKDPDLRWQSARDLATELSWIEEAGGAGAPRRRGAKIAWIVAALAVLAALTSGVFLWRSRGLRLQEAPVRTFITPPPNYAFVFDGPGAPPAISPDGKTIVFGAAEAGKGRILWVRRLDSLVAQPLAGTEGAMFPFWSPDGRSIGFFADNALKKTEAAGGATVVVCTVADGRGGSWSADGSTIIFAGRYTPIYRVSSAGGTPVVITKLEPPMTSHRWPAFLPDGRHFLYLAALNGAVDPSNTICLGRIDGHLQKRLIAAANNPLYFERNIVFARDGILTAQPFDPKKLELAGDPVSLKEQQIATVQNFSRAALTLSDAGTLVYQTGVPVRDSQLTWYDRSGKPLGNVADAAPYHLVSLSPDESRVVVSYAAPSQTTQNLWLIDLVRGVKTRLTFGSTRDSWPLWSPDGKRIAYSTVSTAGASALMIRDLTNGSEEAVVRGGISSVPQPTSWSPGGENISYFAGGILTRADISWLSLADRKTHLYLGTPAIEAVGRFSPDGRWLAYQSNESGVMEVYLAPFPPTGAKWQVSNGGGVIPRWRSDGRELYYSKGGSPNTMLAVPITLGATPQIGQSQPLFQFRPGFDAPIGYDVSRDGQRFLINSRIGDDPPSAPMILVQHFDNELRAALEHRD